MRRSSLIAFSCLLGLLLASGCQHHARAPLELNQYLTEMESRAVGLGSIEEWAATLTLPRDVSLDDWDPADGLTLTAAKAVALAYNSAVRCARQEREHAVSVARVAGRWEDPELGVSGGQKRTEAGSRAAEFSVEPDPGAPLASSYSFRREVERTIDRAWIREGSLSITLPTSGRLQAERALSGSVVEAAERALAETKWRTLTDLQDAWLVWSAEQERLATLEEHLEALGVFVRIAEALREAGELIPADARLFAIEYARLAAEHAERKHLAAALRLDVLHRMGLLPDAPVTLVPALSVVDAGLDELPSAEAIVASHPQMARVRADYEIAEEALRVELRRQYPDITLSPAYSDERAETALTLGLGFPLPVWNANRRGIAEALAARERARAAVESALEEILRDVAQAQQRFEGAHAHWRSLREEIAPMVDTQVAEVEAMLRLGEIELMMIHQTLDQALVTKRTLIDTHLTAQQAALRLAAVVGMTTGDPATREDYE